MRDRRNPPADNVTVFQAPTWRFIGRKERIEWDVEENKSGDGPDLDAKGNILDHEYQIGEGRDKVAEVSKKWFRVRDSYGVAIDPGQNDVLILAVTVAIDMMAHEGR